MHYLSSLYLVNQPLNVSGMFVAHHQEEYCIYTTMGTCCAFQLTVCWPPANRLSTDGLQKCPKRLEVDWRNKLRINIASSWLLLHKPFYTITIQQSYPLPIKLINTKINTYIPSCKVRFQIRRKHQLKTWDSVTLFFNSICAAWSSKLLNGVR
jgi:hypothetical protein